MNLFKETMAFLFENNLKKPNFIKCRDHDAEIDETEAETFGKISWERFKELADIEYHDGYGNQEIRGSLMMVWDRCIAIRVTYDGAEWWELINISEPKRDYKDNTLLNGTAYKKRIRDLDDLDEDHNTGFIDVSIGGW